jgi:GTPase SAR1 family protein
MESPAKYLSYDFTYLRQEFLEIINDFSEELRLEKFQNAVGKKLFKQIQTQINQILNRLDEDFVLVVIGDFKRGKSTLINALLGEIIVTTDVLPETVTINHIKYGSELKINVYLTNGGQVQLDKEELKSEQLNQILAQLPQPVSHLSIEAPNEWLRGLRLVDTPGTGDIFKRFDRQIHAYLLKADAVMYVTSALAPFAESEQAFLQMSVIPQDFPKVFFVLNRMDDIRTERDAVRLLNSTYKKISNLFPNPQLFGISALDEFYRIQSLSRPNPACASILEKAFNEFRQCLDQTIRLQRDLIQLDRATDHMEQMLQEVENSLLLLRNAMQADQERLNLAIHECEDPTSELYDKIAQHIKVMKDEINQLSEQACKWMNDFIVRINNEAFATIYNFKDEDIKRHFQFFLNNSFREAIDKCLAFHQAAIFASYKKAIKAIIAEFKFLNSVSTIVDNVNIKTEITHEYSWTDFDTFEILSECDTSFIADLIIRQIQDLKLSEHNVNYQQKIQAALPDFELALVKEIRLLYQNIAIQIEQKIESAYSQDIETSLSVMQQAQEVCAQEAQTVTATNEVLQEALSIVHHAREQLKPLKQKLCSEDMLEIVSIKSWHQDET